MVGSVNFTVKEGQTVAKYEQQPLEIVLEIPS
jgi:hypothetical protein